MVADRIIHRIIHIDAPIASVWNALTNPDAMKTWMADSVINITDLAVTWQVGSSLVIRGDLHGIPYETQGIVLNAEPEQFLQYTNWSSLSELPDTPENHSVIAFRLTSMDKATTLTFTERNFATEIIYKHSEFYWNTTLEILKKLLEESKSTE
ncbi:SRPBCC domain-containing protein [Spirosoma harenae]